jgi:hypothetical protein
VTPDTLDLMAGWASLVLTLLVFSYLLGDNVLYRIAIHVLVGVAAGYIAVVAVESVLVPWLNDTLLAEQGARSDATMVSLRVIGAVPFLFGVLLLFKMSPRLAPVGNLGLAVVIGIGTAVAVVGAVAGTVIPLAREAGDAMGDDILEGLIIVVGTVTTLLYFQYWVVERDGEIRAPRLLRPLGAVGRLFVMVALGALYAGAIVTSITIFGDVIDAQIRFILDRVGG